MRFNTFPQDNTKKSEMSISADLHLRQVETELICSLLVVGSLNPDHCRAREISLLANQLFPTVSGFSMVTLNEVSALLQNLNSRNETLVVYSSDVPTTQYGLKDPTVLKPISSGKHQVGHLYVKVV